MKMLRPPPPFPTATRKATDEQRFEWCTSEQSERKSGNKRPHKEFVLDDEHANKRVSSKKSLLSVMGHEEVATVLEQAAQSHDNLEEGLGLECRLTWDEVDISASITETVPFSRAHSNDNKTVKQGLSTREQESETVSARNVLQTSVHDSHFSDFGLHIDPDLIKDDIFECVEMFQGRERVISSLSKVKDAKCRRGHCSNPHRAWCSAGDCQDAPNSSFRTMVENEAKELELGPQLDPCDQGLRRGCASATRSRVLLDVTNKFQIDAAPAIKKRTEEDDVHRLSQRYKQIEFGKNTLGYERYIELVPKGKRKNKDPKTPNPKQICSKRSWDGQIRKWRRLLHDYDLPLQEGEELAEDLATLKSSERQKKHGDDHDGDASDDDVPCNWSDGMKESKSLVMARKELEMSIYEDWLDF